MSIAPPTAVLATLTGILAGRVEPPSFDDASWPAILDLAADHSLLPALWVAVRERSALDSMPPAAVHAIHEHLPGGVSSPDLVLHRAYVANAERNAMLLDEGVAVLAALRDAGVDALPIKGLHGLLSEWWTDPAARVMVDLDILIRPEQGHRAQDSVRTLGYELDPETSGELADHELPGMRRDDRWTLELHTGLLMRRFDAVLPPEAAWQRSVEVPTGRVLLDADAVVVSIAHGELQDFSHALGELPLRALVDIRERCRAGASPVDWDAIRRSFRAARRSHVLDAHLVMARSLLGAEVPTVRSARARLHLRRVLTELDHPRVRAVARWWTYLPITYSRERMRVEYGDSIRLWPARLRHGTASVLGRAQKGVLAVSRRARRIVTPASRLIERRTRRVRRRVRALPHRAFIELNHDLSRTILVVGGGRSGTTWFAEVLNWQQDYRFIFEPFRSDLVRAAAPFTQGEYVDPDVADPARLLGATAILSGRIRTHWTDHLNVVHLVRQRIVKCIRICNLVPWVQRQFPDVRLVYLIRHPGAVAASRIRAGFPDLVDDYRALPGLCDGPLLPFADAIARFATSDNRLERHVLQWCMENWIPLVLSDPSLHVVCYEHLVVQPRRELDRLATFLGIPMDGHVARRLAKPGSIGGDSANLAATRSGRVDAWTERVDLARRERVAEILTAFGLDAVYGVAPEPRCASADVLAAVRGTAIERG